jgi:flagellar biosynthesis protein FliP
MEQLFGKMDPALQLMILMGVLSLLPFILVSLTSFTRYVIVLSILKTALGTQQVPPGVVMVGISLILTIYTMGPVFGEMYDRAEVPIKNNQSIMAIMTEASEPLKEFMMRQTRQQDISYFIELSRKTPPNSPQELSIWEVAPAFMISELRTSFEIGFLIFIPFIVLDLVVANILLALGMMMLSPTIISLPFKILVFIAVDGWGLIINGLVHSYN